jgi:hypothetical protein
MKLAGLILFMLTLLAQTNPIINIRRLYQRAALYKTDAQELDKLVREVNSKSLPLLLCYKGANEMIKAKHSFNPIAKLDQFSRGKNFISTAFSRDSLNLEMRFIRFSLQSNLPGFLGYRGYLKTDKIYILGHLADCPDADLKHMVTNYLTNSASLTPEEMKQIRR